MRDDDSLDKSGEGNEGWETFAQRFGTFSDGRVHEQHWRINFGGKNPPQFKHASDLNDVKLSCCHIKANLYDFFS